MKLGISLAVAAFFYPGAAEALPNCQQATSFAKLTLGAEPEKEGPHSSFNDADKSRNILIICRKDGVTASFLSRQKELKGLYGNMYDKFVTIASYVSGASEKKIISNVNQCVKQSLDLNGEIIRLHIPYVNCMARSSSNTTDGSQVRMIYVGDHEPPVL